MSGSVGWTSLRQQARNLETQVCLLCLSASCEPTPGRLSRLTVPVDPALSCQTKTENLFHTYSQFATAVNIPPKPTDEERTTEAKLQEILSRVRCDRIRRPVWPPLVNGSIVCSLTVSQRESVIGQLTRLLDSEASLSSSSLKQNNLALLRDKLAAHRRDLTRLRSNISTARDRVNLLTSVRSDIDAHRAAAAADNPEAAEAEYMLDERRRLDNSHNVADSVLSQAYAVNDSFGAQRETLSSINRRITHAVGQVPGLNSLIGRISAKKRRDGIIMGVFIALCFFVFWWLL